MQNPMSETQMRFLAERRFLEMYNASKPKSEPPTLQDKNLALRYICNGTTSLPTITIATRDRIEAEMIARRRSELEQKIADIRGASDIESGATSPISPAPLDTP